MNVSVEGAELHYTTRGAGPACLVLSAIGARPYMRLTPRQLSEHLRLVYVDLRGGGESTGAAADLTFDLLADDLEAIRIDLGVETVAVLGHSILGALAIEYARRCPDTVSHVIAVGTPPEGDMARLTEAGAAFFERDASEERKKVLRENMARLPPGASMGRILFAQTPMRYYDARFDPAPLFTDAIVRPELLAHIMGNLLPSWNITKEWSSMRVPLFVALGRCDYTVPFVLWHEIAAKLPGVTLEVFERSGHQPFFEEPGRFVAVLTDWMSRRI